MYIYIYEVDVDHPADRVSSSPRGLVVHRDLSPFQSAEVDLRTEPPGPGGPGGLTHWLILFKWHDFWFNFKWATRVPQNFHANSHRMSMSSDFQSQNSAEPIIKILM